MASVTRSYRSVRRCVLLALALTALSAANAQELLWPHEAPGDWLLAFVDVETTGLLPGHHEMIDIGIVITDLDGAELDELFVRIQPEHPERTSEGARAVNAFDEDRWRELGALSTDAAISLIVGFHKEIAGDRNVLMVAFNSHFDASFLDQLRSRERNS